MTSLGGFYYRRSVKPAGINCASSQISAISDHLCSFRAPLHAVRVDPLRGRTFGSCAAPGL